MTDQFSREEEHLRFMKQEEERIESMERSELESLAKRNHELQKIINSGRACKQFIDSDVGRFLLDRAIHDSEMAKSELTELDPANFTTKWAFEAKHQELRNLARTPMIIFGWLQEAIQAAEDADTLINEEDNS